MTISLSNIIISLLKTNDKSLVAKKVESIENELTLTDVEKNILKDVKESLRLGKLPAVDFFQKKHSYYFDLDDDILPTIIEKDEIDSAILDIKVKQQKRNIKNQVLDIISKADSETTKETIDKLGLVINQSIAMEASEPPKNALGEKKDAYAQLTNAKGTLSLGIPEVEACAGKAAYGTLISIAAFTGSFKSTLSLNIALANALNGYNVLYLALEMTSDEMENRLLLDYIARTSHSQSELINGLDIRENRLTDDQKDFYNKKHNEMVKKLDNHLILWDSTAIKYQTFLDMENQLRQADRMFFETTGKGLDAVIVDQVSLLKYTKGSGRKASYEGAIINDWVDWFEDQTLNFLDTGRKIVTFMVSQVRREAYAEASKPKKKGRYDASCSSDSSEIEKASTTMITLYKDLEMSNTLLVNVPKARQGFIPDNPIQVEVYGEYYHIGPLNVAENTITKEDFSSPSMKLEDLLGG